MDGWASLLYFLFVIDYVYRAFQTVIIIYRYWGYSAVGM